MSGKKSTIVRMKMIADTNTFIAVALNEPEKDKIIQLTKGCNLAAPDVLPFEIGNALTAMMKKGSLHSDEIQTSWKIIQHIPVELRRVDFKSALNIAVTFNIYAYDAYFLECADSLKCPLITLDQGMMAIARKMGILVLE
jgi:predicted nucleic acid-binding protein